MTDVPDHLRTHAQDALHRCHSFFKSQSFRVVGASCQSIEQLQAVVHSQLTEIVDELGTQGGPRVQRIDHLFATLLGSQPVARAGEAGGLLGEIGSHLDKDSDHVNSVEDEQNLTGFRVLVDYIKALQTSWNSHKSTAHDRKHKP